MGKQITPVKITREAQVGEMMVIPTGRDKQMVKTTLVAGYRTGWQFSRVKEIIGRECFGHAIGLIGRDSPACSGKRGQLVPLFEPQYGYRSRYVSTYKGTFTFMWFEKDTHKMHGCAISSKGRITRDIVTGGGEELYYEVGGRRKKTKCGPRAKSAKETYRDIIYGRSTNHGKHK